jgi:hypothetical protein
LGLRGFPARICIELLSFEEDSARGFRFGVNRLPDLLIENAIEPLAAPGERFRLEGEDAVQDGANRPRAKAGRCRLHSLELACRGCAPVNCTAAGPPQAVLSLTRCIGGFNGATLRTSSSRSVGSLALAGVLVCKDGRVLATRISGGGFSCAE